MLNLTHVTICGLNRRDALGAAAALLTVSLSARSVGLSALAQVPEKIVLGTLSITPALASYIGQIEFFKEEGLTVELSRFNNFAPVVQEMAAGSVAAGDIGVAPGIIVLIRGVPLIAPFLGGFTTQGHPFEQIMVRAIAVDLAARPYPLGDIRCLSFKSGRCLWKSRHPTLRLFNAAAGSATRRTLSSTKWSRGSSEARITAWTLRRGCRA